MATAAEVRASLDLIAARRGFGEAFAEMFAALEGEPFEAEALCILRDRARVGAGCFARGHRGSGRGRAGLELR